MARPDKCSEIVLVPDERMLATHAAREMPNIGNMNVTNSKKIHVGPKFVSVSQTVHNKETIKGHVLGLELVSSKTSRRLRCSVAVFLCWALLVSSGLAVYLFYLAYYEQVRIDIELPLHLYLWNVLKATTRAERLACAGATTALVMFIIPVVYYSMFAQKTLLNEEEDHPPHEWQISRPMWLSENHIWNKTQDAFKPLKIVVIAHTAGATCYSFSECSAVLRNLQIYLMNKDNWDIQYNFLVGNDGLIYEGLGWNREGAHTRSYNNCTLGVAFMGNYESSPGTPGVSVTDLQVKNIFRLFEQGITNGNLDPDYLVVGARDISSTISPGLNVYNAIREWPMYDMENRFKSRTCNEIYGINKTLDEVNNE